VKSVSFGVVGRVLGGLLIVFDTWTKQVSEPKAIAQKDLQGFWVQSAATSLYTDRYDQNHNSALHKETPASPVLLLIKDNRYARLTVRRNCPFPLDDAKWLVDMVTTTKQEPDKEPQKIIIPETTAAGLYEKAVALTEQFSPFEINGQTFKTERTLRGRAPRLEEQESRVIEASAGVLQIAHIDHRVEHGVHTVIESFKPITDDELKDLFTESLKAPAECKTP
jgi:hypothetical protein